MTPPRRRALHVSLSVVLLLTIGGTIAQAVTYPLTQTSGQGTMVRCVDTASPNNGKLIEVVANGNGQLYAVSAGTSSTGSSGGLAATVNQGLPGDAGAWPTIDTTGYAAQTTVAVGDLSPPRGTQIAVQSDQLGNTVYLSGYDSSAFTGRDSIALDVQVNGFDGDGGMVLGTVNQGRANAGGATAWPTKLEATDLDSGIPVALSGVPTTGMTGVPSEALLVFPIGTQSVVSNGQNIATAALQSNVQGSIGAAVPSFANASGCSDGTNSRIVSCTTAGVVNVASTITGTANVAVTSSVLPTNAATQTTLATVALPVGSAGAPTPSSAELGGCSDGTNLRSVACSSAGNVIVVGAGVAGTPSGGVASVQGVAGGTALPISATALPLPTGAATQVTLATVASPIAATGTTAPANAGLDGCTDGTDIRAVSCTSSGFVKYLYATPGQTTAANGVPVIDALGKMYTGAAATIPVACTQIGNAGANVIRYWQIYNGSAASAIYGFYDSVAQPTVGAAPIYEATVAASGLLTVSQFKLSVASGLRLCLQTSAGPYVAAAAAAVNQTYAIEMDN